jgi:hypothetical protein
MTILNIQFDDVHFLNDVKFGSIEFQPLKFLFKNKTKNLKSIDQLFDEDLVSVEEIGVDGRVGEVNVKNYSKDFLFVTDGEAIVGAKQNRIAERSVVVAPYFSQRIPVKCVEQYRWGYKEGTEFAKSDFVLHPKAREEKAELLKKGENNKIQNAVWDNIECLSAKHEVECNSMNLGDILDNSKKYYDFDYFDRVRELEFNAYIVSGAGRTFIEFFYDNEVCKRHVKKSIKGWMADNDDITKSIKINKEEVVKSFIKSEWTEEESISVEQAYSSDLKNNGRCVFFAQNLIHAYYYV